ncbi:hypothetical protein [Niallia sp. Krafla_26]|uniref:hypothetical protein n=1 Tax=Niallia sp. Krafla_26 TaxID=3064703 RepID=UPI003D179A21
MANLTEESLMSLFIRMYYNETSISSGTAFIVTSSSGYFLITNRQNITGRNSETNKPFFPTGAIPKWRYIITG